MPYADIFDAREPLGKPFLASMALHGSVVVLLVAGSFFHGSRRPIMGDIQSAGGVVGVNPVSRIPMMARSGTVNRVANDTESQVPQAPPQPKPVPQKAKPPEPNAIPLKGRAKPEKYTWQVTAPRDRYRPYTEPKPNQLYSSTPGALVSPAMGMAGSGGVGLGRGSSLGDRFGAYASLLQQVIAQHWNTQDVDPRLRTAPAVVMTFTILRDGTISSIRVKTSSGNTTLDRSAERALYDVGKVDPLPAGYDRNEAEVEFNFVLKR
jgi:TonB family protein